jgi:aminoglycoside phosphotransferase (APT) family kinase protein
MVMSACSDEVPIDEALVRRLLARQFPQWAELPIVAADSFGTDNAMYRLGEEMAVRLPRFPRWAPQVDREQRWLPRLSPCLPLAVPVPLAMGAPAEGYPFRWSVYPWLDGENPTIERIADPDQAARDLAGFITALQRIDPAGGPPPESSNAFRGVPMGDRRPSIAVDTRVRPMIAALDGVVDINALTGVWEAALVAAEWDGPPVWIHGDLAPTNLLAVDGRLSAVIDFGCLGVGDPACDLMVAWTFLSTTSRSVFRTALAADDATWARGRGWGLAMTLPSPAAFTDTDPVRAARARRVVEELISDHQRDHAVRTT